MRLTGTGIVVPAQSIEAPPAAAAAHQLQGPQPNACRPDGCRWEGREPGVERGPSGT